MASNILIKRSTGSTAPGSITFGELAITTGANGNQANAGDRLFVGDNNGAAQIVGGRYFMDMLDHVHGTLTADSAAIVDSNSKIDNWLVDDVQINSNFITTSTTDTDLIFRANGTGKLVIEDGQELEFGTTGDVEFSYNDSDAVLDVKRVTGTPDLRIADDMKLIFGTDKNSSIVYDETTNDKLLIDGADIKIGTTSTAKVNFANTYDANNVADAAVTIAGGLGVAATAHIKDLNVDDNTTIGTTNGDSLTVNSTTTFQNGVTFNGTTTLSGNTSQTGKIEIDNLKLDGNTLSTINSVQELILDPDPATDAGGLVIIKGDLQIDGTTTTVNSASMSVNDPTIELGDPTTPVTLTAEATGGQAVVVVDAIDQLQVGDSVTSSAAGIPNSTVINSINTGTKAVTLSNNLSQTMAVGAVLVTVSGADDALDRGVKVHYNASGTNQFGFFGYDRTGGQDGAGAWTFIENATDTNTVFGVTGDRGTVVLGDLELDTDLEVQFGGTGVSTFTTNGILYGNAAGAVQVTAEANMSTPGAGADVSTSFQVLTVTAAGVPVWTDTIDGGTF
ncbi:hypothetical protein CPMG_00029 [Prochlorococcus phage MED4-213]|uniref:Major tropism determinant N-terminal domain-containing protein n=1 Tax=Prochlorococcus phage MED4-213 TaxID=889956 RepID=M4QPX2_9CAUD|nr:hypothetical protein CPMG_00029 [Prochlorococcus phage MED4-213]AGH26130.1 hypothetical protein CPMG_00029 [Prochlorococcus phage MED4-213]